MHNLKTAALAAGLATGLALAPASAADLDAIAQAMGAARLESLEFSGSGDFFILGQNLRPDSPWPRMNLTRYVRTMDYAKSAMRLDFTFTQGENPPSGGGGQPFAGEQRRTSGVSGNDAWSPALPPATPTRTGAAPLQHDLWTSPHGIVKAAIADKAKTETAGAGTVFEIARPGFKARATANAANLIEKVESWIDNPVFGDMAVVTTYADYKDHNGVKFPARILQSQGGHPVFEINVAEVKPGAGAVEVPPQIAAPAAQEVAVEKVADGVWFLHGGSHHSAAIEMRDHVILFESPLGDGRAGPVIDAVKRTIPGKPIRYVVNTHHHFDHSGGLRAAAAEDAIIVTHAINRPFFERAYAAPRTLNPDRLARSGKSARFETFGEKHTMTDGARTLELHLLQGSTHNAGLIVGYLPKEKMLLVADAFSPRTPVTQTPAQQNPFTTNLWENLNRLKLDIDTILPIHGRFVKIDELRTEVGAQAAR